KADDGHHSPLSCTALQVQHRERPTRRPHRDSAARREVAVFENSPPRLELLSVPELDQAQRALYDAITGGPRSSQRGTVPITDSDGRLVGPFAIMLLSPEVGDAVQRVGAAVRFTSSLTGREREVAILAVAAGARCDFEWLAHSV